MITQGIALAVRKKERAQFIFSDSQRQEIKLRLDDAAGKLADSVYVELSSEEAT